MQHQVLDRSTVEADWTSHDHRAASLKAAILANRPARQRRNLISPSTVRRSRSPKMCWCTVWLNTLLTFTVVVMAPLCHFTPKLPFTVAYPSV